MKHENRYIFLDLARGISALLVCAGHLRSAMFVDYQELISTNTCEKTFYFFTSLGHQAVIIFFVLSGFFVGGSVLYHWNEFQFKNYLLARLSRLWVVLFPALIFTLIVDQMILYLFPNIISGGFYYILSSGPNKNNVYSVSIETFFLNLSFFQNILTPVFGSNGPLWSLANEFWYYILFPLIVIIFSVKSSLSNRIVSILLIWIIILFIAQNMIDGFLIWLLGVAVYLTYEKNVVVPSNAVFFMLPLFLIALVDSKTMIFYKTIGLSNDFFVAFCFSAFLISIKNKSMKFGKRYMVIISRWLSEISYTLYLFHFPLILLIFGVFYKEKQIVPNFLGLLYYFLFLILLLLVSHIMWWIFERNTPEIREYLRSHLIKNRN